MLADNTKILVTGGSGFLGRHLIESLQGSGIPVRVAVNRGDAPTDMQSDFEIFRGDLTDRRTAMSAVAGVSRIFHCAAVVGDWAKNDRFEAVNVAILANILDAIRQTKSVRRLVHVSSTDVYGHTGRGEDENALLTAAAAGYGASKLECERLLRAEANGPVSIKIVRPSSIYGAHSKSLVLDVLDFAKWPIVPLFGKDVLAGLVEVRDVVACLHAAMNEKDSSFNIYNVCGTEPITWRQYITALAELIGEKEPRFVRIPLLAGYGAAAASEAIWRIPMIKGRPPISRTMVLLSGRDQMFPIGKARERLGFEPRISFTDGLRAIRAWLTQIGRIEGRSNGRAERAA